MSRPIDKATVAADLMLATVVTIVMAVVLVLLFEHVF